MNETYEVGEVVELRGSLAGVEMTTSDACQTCGARGLCRPDSKGRRILFVKNSLDARIGDRVRIYQSGKNQLRLALFQYGLPLIAFLIMVVFVSQLSEGTIAGIPGDLFSFLMGLIALMGAGFIGRRWCRRMASRDFAVFSIKEIVS